MAMMMMIMMIVNIDRFAVLNSRYFSVCDWRLFWYQFLADMKENPVFVFVFCCCFFFSSHS